jgi:hypothetical protein
MIFISLAFGVFFIRLLKSKQLFQRIKIKEIKSFISEIEMPFLHGIFR